jgi:Abnormal spindle-like microcephaly-assoc'd, ASPM-SPD-2-Hydin/PQQ-like domain
MRVQQGRHGRPSVIAWPRASRAGVSITAAALAVAGTLTGVLLTTAGSGHAAEYTVSQNVSRDGWDGSESALSPAAVHAKRFGEIFETRVNGQVFAQPLVVGNSVLVATEDDYVYSINRVTGRVNWSRQLGTPYAAAAEDCGQTPVVEPYIGVTSTPVYDPSTKTLYVSGMLSGPPGDDSDLSTATPTYDLFAVNETTGAIKWKKAIGGSPTDNSGNTFNAALQLQRPGLLLFDGSVYLGFGALCADGAADHQYIGYIAGVNTKTRSETLWTDMASDPGDPGQYGGIWQGGGGLLSIGKSIYFATANGTAPPQGTPGRDAPTLAHLGQSMIRMDVEKNGTLKPVDFFSPGDADRMTSVDHDFGSGGPILLPFGTKDYPKLFVTADKEATIYLLNPSGLGGRSTSPTGSTAVYTASPALVHNPPGVGEVAHGLWGHMTAFAGVGAKGKKYDYIYYEGTGWGATDNMYVLDFDGANPRKPVLKNIGATIQSFGFSSGSPVITSTGSKASSAVVWEVQTENDNGTDGTLDAFDAVPTSKHVLKQIWTAPIGHASQFTTPATSNGRVYVGTRNDGSAITSENNNILCPTNFQSATYTRQDSSCVGEVYAFGTRSPAHLAGSNVSLGRVDLGRTATKTVTLRNTGDSPVWITKITSPSAPFGTPDRPALRQPVQPDGTVRFPVTFTPQAKGTSSGKYVVRTSDGFSSATTTVTVSGTGAAAAKGTAAVPSPGGGWTLHGSAQMTGTTLQLTPAAANASGSAVFYQPLASNGLHAKFTASLGGGSGGDGLTFALLNPARSTAASAGNGGAELGFGGLSGVAVVLGTHREAGDPAGNFIGIATGVSSGHLVFAATATHVPSLRSGPHVIGVTVSGGRISVTVNGKRYLSAAVSLPSSVLAAFTAANGSLDDIHAVSGVSVYSGSERATAPGGGWSFNGTAGMAGAAAELTKAIPYEAGAVVYPRAEQTASFSATFSTTLAGGTGGEGVTLALLNPGTSAASVGTNGQGFGFAGLNGLAVVLGTYEVSGAPSGDFVGIEGSTGGGDPSFLATADLSGKVNLRAGTHTVTVSLSAGTLTVTIDGSRVLTQTVTVPSSAYVAFTGSTGTLTDQHLVQDAAIWAS